MIGKDRFEIGALLGAGAFGEVFRAFDREREISVALKVLRNVNPRALSLFKQEFRSLAKVVHPNLIQFYELFAEENQWFFTMELLEGIDLLQYIRGQTADGDSSWSPVPQSTIQQSESQILRPSEAETSLDSQLPPPLGTAPTVLEVDSGKTDATAAWQYQTVELPGAKNKGEARDFDDLKPHPLSSPEAYERLKTCFGQLALGVCALHDAQKLHRDLKPANTLVVDDGRVVMLDFGLVKDLGSDLEGDDEAEIVGTPRYMSPEQAEGHDVGEASDWYSVGVMLYEALVGYAPFTGSARSILKEKLRKDPIAPRELVPDIPEAYNDLCMGLLRRDPKQRLQGKDVLRALGMDAGESPPWSSEAHSPSSNGRLVGRDKHLAVLHESFQRSREGHSVGVYIHGHSGMGKSYLVQHFLAEVADKHGALVLGGSCYQRESIPYKGWDDGITEIAGLLSRLPYKESLDYIPEDIGAIVQLFPVLKQVEAIAELVATPLKIKDPTEIRRRAYRGVKELLLRLSSKHAVVWAVEDLQWSDYDSAVLLGEVLKPPGKLGMLYLGSYRSDEVKNNPMLKEALKALPFPDLEVGGLSEEDVELFARELMGDDFDESLNIEELTKESGGSPYFLSELLRYALNASQGQISRRLDRVQLDDMIRDRVAQLRPQAREFLEVLAVAGHPVRLRSLESCLGKESVEARALALLKTENFVLVTTVAGEAWVECFHDRIRESVFHGLSAEKRSDYHGRLAQVLSTEEDMDAGSVAFHFKEAGEIDKATRYALKAAHQAYETLAFAKAVQLFEVALQTGILNQEEQREALIRRGQALTNLGQGRQGAAEFLAAAELSTPAQALGLQQRAAHQFFTTGYMEDGVSTMRGVLAKVGMTLPDYSNWDFLPMLARDMKLRWRGIDFEEVNESEVEQEALIRIDSCWSVVAALATVDVIASMDFCMRMLLFALEVGEPDRIARAFAAQAYMDVNVGRIRRRAQLSRGHQFLGQATALAERLNQPYLLAFVAFIKGSCAYSEGHFRRAYEQTEKAVATFRDHCLGVSWELDSSYCFMLWNLRNLGEARIFCEIVPERVENAKQRKDLYALLCTGGISLNWYLMFKNEGKEALEEVGENLKKCGKMVGRSASLVFWAQTRTQIDQAIYFGRGQEAWSIALGAWRELTRLKMFELLYTRISCWENRGRAALCAAMENSQQRPFLISEARRAAARLDRELTDHAKALGQLIRLGADSLAGRKDKLESGLAEIEERFQRLDMKLHAAVCRRQRGLFIGGDAGQRFIEEAEQFMTEQSIVHPGKICAVLAPGFQ